jgi:hypothetical protein
MNYELAKQLKDAGFPLPPSPSSPTPANLFYGFRLGKTMDGWRADKGGTDFVEIGSTPKEAVAKLWLALHPN